MVGKTVIKWPEMRSSIILCWQHYLLQVFNNMNKAVNTNLWRRKIIPSLFNSGIGARLPAAYRKFYDEWKNTSPAPVHYKPYEGCKWQRNPGTGNVKRIENFPLPLKFPKEFHEVFTGGEAIIQGFQRRKRKFFKRVPHFWTPTFNENVVYSEILDKYFSVVSTRRLLDLITENEGFDNYILRTKACDLQSFVALRFKQRLLRALNDRQLPYDEEKNKKIFEKYKKYLIPPEEIEWYSLSFSEACAKQKKIEEESVGKPVALKHYYRIELIKYLKQESTKKGLPLKDTSWQDKLSKLPKFLNFSGTPAKKH